MGKKFNPPNEAAVAGGFFFIGLASWLLSPITQLEILDVLDPIIKYGIIAALIAGAGYAGYVHNARLGDKANAVRIASWSLLMLVLFYAALILGRVAIPTGVDYTAAIATHDKYVATVGRPTLVASKKLGSVTIFPVTIDGADQQVALLPRDVFLPGVAVQTRAGDIAARLTENQGEKVCIKDIGFRRGKGPIYIFDFTQFPNPYYVSADLSKCGS
jgi:hypothetical protein